MALEQTEYFTRVWSSDQNMIDVVVDAREGGDWSLDLLFAGLVLNLGPERVADVPYRDKHREWGRSYCKRDWGAERRTLGYTSSNESVKGLFALTPDNVRRVWIDERMESYAIYKSLGVLHQAKVVVVAGHDRFWNHNPRFVAGLYGDNFEAMLLDNWYPEYESLPFRARKIGWSCNFDHYWTRPTVAPAKDIDISFMGYASHLDRVRFVEHVKKRWGHLNNKIMLEREPDTMKNFVPKSTYFDIMLRSKICLNLRGGADMGKALRAYEIPYVGSYMLSQRIDDPGMRDDFVDGIDCSYFSNEDELDSCVRYALDNERWREAIASAGHQAATGKLSVKQRWKDVLEWLDGSV